MSEMVERVARALYESEGSDMLAKADHAFPKPSWDRAHPALKDDCRVKARAAIEAMREPVWAMRRAGIGAEPDFEYVWLAMIDAALAEEKTDA
jgi:hypothetical protein